jgi:ABC-2 type transport system permease protein
MVHKGTLSQWLMRPLSFFETAASHKLAKILILLIPGLIVIILGFALIPSFPSPEPGLSVLYAIAVLPLSIAMFGILSAVIGMISFWTMNTDSVFALVMLILEFFGGRLLPLSFLPGWLQHLSDFLPLRFAISLPAEVMLNPGSNSVFLIFGGQLFWCLALLGIAYLLWNQGLKRYDAVGG